MITTSSVCSKKLDRTGQHMLTLADYTSEEIIALVDKAYDMKHTEHQAEEPLKGKILGMIFEKSSTRTRVSFEAGMLQLGGHALYLNSNDIQIGRGETIADTAKVLSNYVDGIMIRTFSHGIIEELATHASIPVINGLTDLYHPCQALADLLTIKEQKGKLKGIQCVYVGDGNNVAHSLMIAAAKVGMHITVACPKGYEPDEKVVALVQGIAKKTGSKIIVENDVQKAVIGADVVYTDVWTSMGQEEENELRLQKFHDYQVNETLVADAKADFLFLHCLPAHRGEEVSATVIDGSHSVVFQQAGNRLHAQKALLTELL